jgi:hypothetical protein
MRARVGIIGISAALAVGLLSAPAVAAPTDDTIVTFVVSAGTLDIVAPESASLGTGAPGTTIGGPLGAVTVTDSRGATPAPWTASVISANFTGDPSGSVAATQVDYWSGPATATTGDGTFTPGQVDSAAKLPLDTVTPVTAFSHVGGVGGNSATWNPTLEVRVPLAAPAATYTGTVTHSVA